ncbi:MAG: hypothetical protein K1X28_10575 [Parachlamydiales bacterium]|nr:hypothetical protein [Parachlamydiales bacterium]
MKFLYLLFACTALFSNECFLEAKAGYFLPTGSRFKKVFSGSGIYGLEFDIHVKKAVYSWMGVDYFYQSGNATNGSSGNIQMARLNAGLMLVSPYFEKIQPYLGAGPQLTYIHTHTSAPTLIHNQGNWGAGGLFRTGVYIKPFCHFLIDIFANYSQQTISMHQTKRKPVTLHKADVSGFSFGAGLAYRF